MSSSEKKHEENHDLESNNAIPAPENGGHARSVAAHLQDHSHIHDNKNAIQHHVPLNEQREPPQEVTRTGKGHRGE